MRLKLALLALGIILVAALYPPRGDASSPAPLLVLVTDRNGVTSDRLLSPDRLRFEVAAVSRRVRLSDILSYHSSEPASPAEAERISVGLPVIQGKGLRAAEAAAENLADIGLPVLTPLLRAYEDRDGREPDPLYRLFERIVPGIADGPDRGLDLVRLKNGTAFRGKLRSVDQKVFAFDRKGELDLSNVRRLAVQTVIDKRFTLQSMRDCTYVGWKDLGIITNPGSELTAESAGYARLSFDEDGWSSDPDGIPDPLPGKRRLQEGFRWGAVLGRVGAGGERFLVGKKSSRKDLGAGRLYFAINDNEHWQNNVGSYRTHVTVTNAYDIGDPQ